MVMKTLFFVLVTFCILGQLVLCTENPYLQAVNDNHLAQRFIHGYVEVRPGAHLFYLFYYADGTKHNATQKPLIIWIQGGPGFAASGLGNFGEFGPLTMDLQPRNHTWVKGRNILLIDHPVGVGFSYATSNDLYVKSDKEIAIDLSQAIKLFFKRHKIFRNTPTYVIGQSYGGKICPRLAVYLYTAIQRKSLKMNFKGIGIGGGWVNPKESLSAMPYFLYRVGYIDEDTLMNSKQMLHLTFSSLANKDYAQAYNEHLLFLYAMSDDERLNFNNINEVAPYLALSHLDRIVNIFMKPILKRVNQSIEWSFMSAEVHDELKLSILIPSYSFLEHVLNETTLKVVVYNGNYDVIAPLTGASNWVHKLNWAHKEDFAKVKRHRIRGVNNGYYKVMEQLSFWSVFRAGHWVPEENPEAMEHILNYLTTEKNEN